MSVAIETPILLADLEYGLAGGLKAGDAIVGFDRSAPARWRRRKFCQNIIRSIFVRNEDCIEIETEFATVMAALDHAWLRRTDRNTHLWTRTRDLCLGHALMFLGQPEFSWREGELEKVIEGGSIQFARCSTIVGLRYIGEREVAWLGTSAGTLVGGGLLCRANST